MKYLYIISILLLFCSYIQGQTTEVERVYVHTDKDNYVAGEDIWVKFYAVNPDFQPSDLSKVGYIEICDTEKPQIQLKVVLDEGKGAGKIRIPVTIPTGIYQLTGYTRYMRNEGEGVFFKRQIAIVNVGRQTDSDRFRIDEKANSQVKQIQPGIWQDIAVSSNKKEYSKRSTVQIELKNIPQDIADLTVSVFRYDSIASQDLPDAASWRKQVQSATPVRIPLKWLPEYEGHIIEGRVIPLSDDIKSVNPEILKATLGFVGKDIRYHHGQVEAGTGNTKFFIDDQLTGHQEVVTSAFSFNQDPYRLDILSPYAEILPKSLPELQLIPENKNLMDRYVAAQLQQIMVLDSLDTVVPFNYYQFQPHLSYDLDEYTRFNTMNETIIEFVRRIIVRRVGDKRVLKVLREDGRQFNSGNTLVLLDGVPLFDHQDILDYNPRNVRMINIYSGRYLFGGDTYECMASFITHRGDLSAIQLNNNEQLIEYDLPYAVEPFTIPVYTNKNPKEDIKPDFRHTLYWNPFMENEYQQPVSFYTSDMTGRYKVMVEGITKEGKLVYGTTEFDVK